MSITLSTSCNLHPHMAYSLQRAFPWSVTVSDLGFVGRLGIIYSLVQNIYIYLSTSIYLYIEPPLCARVRAGHGGDATMSHSRLGPCPLGADIVFHGINV